MQHNLDKHNQMALELHCPINFTFSKSQKTFWEKNRKLFFPLILKMLNVTENEFEYQWKIFEFSLSDVSMFLYLYYFMNGNVLTKHNGRGSYFSQVRKNKSILQLKIWWGTDIYLCKILPNPQLFCNQVSTT